MLLSEPGKKISVLVQNPYYFEDRFFCSLRLLQCYSSLPSDPEDGVFTNFRHHWNRFWTQELENTPIQIHYQEQTYDCVSDIEGWVHLDLPNPCPSSTQMEWEISIPQEQSKMPVRLTPIDFNHSPFVVISDIDDTIIETLVRRPLKMCTTVLFGNAYTRKPIPDMNKLYTFLAQKGATFLYISKSPVNLYEHIMEVFKVHQFPPGLILLRQFGISKVCDAPFPRHQNFKQKRIETLYSLLQNRKVFLFGDDCEQDVQIYQQVTLSLHLDSCILIRMTSPKMTIPGVFPCQRNPRLVYFHEPLQTLPYLEAFLSEGKRESVVF